MFALPQNSSPRFSSLKALASRYIFKDKPIS
jgi:hypothetical protein